jgi:hypothetical protein
MGIGLCIGVAKLSIKFDNVSSAHKYVEYESSYATVGGPSMELFHE